MVDPFKPFDAFFLFDGARNCGSPLAEHLFGAHPGLHAKHAWRQALRRDCQQTVQHEALLIVAGAATQTFRRVQMRQVELRCVLNRQHDRHLSHAIERLRNVGREDAVRVDLRIIEETVGSLQFGRLERLWKRTLRTARESASQRNETLRQARITQIRLAKFGTCPVICLVLVEQSRLPLRTEWDKVNIDIDGLQAIIHHSARKVWVILRHRAASRNRLNPIRLRAGSPRPAVLVAFTLSLPRFLF